MISTDPDKMFWNCVWKFAATCYFGCYPWFLCDVAIVTWYFFFQRKLVYDQRNKDVHVYIKQKLNNSARIYSI